MNHRNIAAVFDVDGTLIADDSLERIFFRYLWRYDEIGLGALWRAAGGAFCRIIGCADDKAWLRGQDAHRLRRLARDCFEQEVVRRLLPAATCRLKWHQRAGHQVVLLSGTLDLLLDPLAEYLNVSTRLGTTVEIADQKATGRLASSRPFGLTKLITLKRMIEREQAADVDLTRSFAYADHYADRFLLSAVGHPVATNPDRRLRRVAAQRGWMIEDFTRKDTDEIQEQSFSRSGTGCADSPALPATNR